MSRIQKQLQSNIAKKAKKSIVEKGDDAIIEVEVLDVTPDFAKELIGQSYGKQRRVRQLLVDRYARDLREKRWRVTGEPMHLNKKLELINGQHRCHAIVESGITMPSVVIVVTRDEKAFEAMDNGAKRSLNDRLDFMGHEKVNSAIQAGIIYERLDFKPRVLTSGEKLEIITSTHPDDLKVLKRLHCKGITAGMMAAAFRCVKTDRDNAIDFFMQAFHNQVDLEGHMIPQAQLLATWILQTKSDRTIAKTAEKYKQECAYRCIQAWNAWKKGQLLSKLQYRPGQRPPKVLDKEPPTKQAKPARTRKHSKPKGTHQQALDI